MKRRIVVYQKHDKLGKIFHSMFSNITEASRYLGVNKSQISRCLNGVEHYKSAHGFIFEYEN